MFYWLERESIFVTKLGTGHLWRYTSWVPSSVPKRVDSCKVECGRDILGSPIFPRAPTKHLQMQSLLPACLRSLQHAFLPCWLCWGRKYFIIYFSPENKAKKNLEHKHHFFFAFKARTQGEFVNNKPKLAVTLISRKLPGRGVLQWPGAEEVPGAFVLLLVNNTPLFTYSCFGFKRIFKAWVVSAIALHGKGYICEFLKRFHPN